jgi:hypothetical protein
MDRRDRSGEPMTVTIGWRGSGALVRSLSLVLVSGWHALYGEWGGADVESAPFAARPKCATWSVETRRC